jgi:hypothetical protein
MNFVLCFCFLKLLLDEEIKDISEECGADCRI